MASNVPRFTTPREPGDSRAERCPTPFPSFPFPQPAAASERSERSVNPACYLMARAGPRATISSTLLRPSCDQEVGGWALPDRPRAERAPSAFPLFLHAAAASSGRPSPCAATFAAGGAPLFRYPTSVLPFKGARAFR